MDGARAKADKARNVVRGPRLRRLHQQRALEAQKRTASAVPSTGGTIAGASNLASLGQASLLGYASGPAGAASVCDVD